MGPPSHGNPPPPPYKSIHLLASGRLAFTPKGFLIVYLYNYSLFIWTHTFVIFFRIHFPIQTCSIFPNRRCRRCIYLLYNPYRPLRTLHRLWIFLVWFVDSVGTVVVQAGGDTSAPPWSTPDSPDPPWTTRLFPRGPLWTKRGKIISDSLTLWIEFIASTHYWWLVLQVPYLFKDSFWAKSLQILTTQGETDISTRVRFNIREVKFTSHLNDSYALIFKFTWPKKLIIKLN